MRRVFAHAERKLGPEQLEAPGAVPPRVLKGVLEEGSFCEDEVMAEYLGGVLASSRSEVSVDDRGTALLAVISGLSTYQLRTHYTMYTTARQQLVGRDINLANATERKRQAAISCRTTSSVLPSR